MLRIASETKFHSIALFGVTVLLLANAFAIRLYDIFGIPLFFILGIFVEFLLLLWLIYELFHVLQSPLKILWSLLLSAGQGIQQNKFFVQSKNKHPKLFRWIAERFSTKIETGIILTIGIIFAGYFLLIFLGIAEDVFFKDTVIVFDQRILNLILSIRTREQTIFFSFITFIANWESVIFTAFITLAILLRKKQILTAILFTSTLIAAQSMGFIVKNLIGRVRPEHAFSLIDEDSFSFPSGHVIAATVIFGLLGYLLIKSCKHYLSKILIFLGSVFAVLLIAFSRIYLGVHYPSDVLASITLGCFLLSIFITIAEINNRYQLFKGQKNMPLKELLLVPILLVIFSLFSNKYFIKTREIKMTIPPKIITAMGPDFIKQLPNFSETLSGTAMEPINFIYLGNQQQIETLFQQHDWYKADPSTIFNTLKAIAIAIQNKQYLTGPVTPAYLNSKPEDLAFQQATATASFRQRHHTRLWKTDYALTNGQEIWLATASFDQGIELSNSYLPTHRIDPNIDGERDYILKSLNITNPKFIQIIDPQLGKNGGGDQFFTDGKGAIIDLSN